MKIVIAGNYQEFARYVRENRLSHSDARYVGPGDLSKLMGLLLAREDIVRIGTWRERDDIEALDELIEYRCLRGDMRALRR